jgi:hypothetical protein
MPRDAARAGEIVWNGKRKKLKPNQQAAASPSSYWITEVGCSRPFPPPADTTPMVRCSEDPQTCGKAYPFYYVDDCQCEDCREAKRQEWINNLRSEGLLAGPLLEQAKEDERLRRPNLPTSSSASAKAIRMLDDVHGEAICQIKLEAEDEKALIKQIERYKKLAKELGSARALELAINCGHDAAVTAAPAST